MAVSGQFLVRTENRVLSHPQHFSEVILKSYSKDYKKLTLIYESNGVTSVRCLSMLYMALSTSPPSSPPPAPHVHHTLATAAHFQFPGLLNSFPLPGVLAPSASVVLPVSFLDQFLSLFEPQAACHLFKRVL